jgi:DNA-directed RNA polymerase alpha subunit
MVTTRQWKILQMRDKGMTFKSIANVFHRSPVRIMQLHEEAVKKVYALRQIPFCERPPKISKDDFLKIPISELEMDVRLSMYLRDADIRTVGDLKTHNLSVLKNKPTYLRALEHIIKPFKIKLNVN